MRDGLEKEKLKEDLDQWAELVEIFAKHSHQHKFRNITFSIPTEDEERDKDGKLISFTDTQGWVHRFSYKKSGTDETISKNTEKGSVRLTNHYDSEKNISQREITYSPRDLSYFESFTYDQNDELIKYRAGRNNYAHLEFTAIPCEEDKKFSGHYNEHIVDSEGVRHRLYCYDGEVYGDILKEVLPLGADKPLSKYTPEEHLAEWKDRFSGNINDVFLNFNTDDPNKISDMRINFSNIKSNTFLSRPERDLEGKPLADRFETFMSYLNSIFKKDMRMAEFSAAVNKQCAQLDSQNFKKGTVERGCFEFFENIRDGLTGLSEYKKMKKIAHLRSGNTQSSVLPYELDGGITDKTINNKRSKVSDLLNKNAAKKLVAEKVKTGPRE